MKPGLRVFVTDHGTHFVPDELVRELEPLAPAGWDIDRALRDNRTNVCRRIKAWADTKDQEIR